MTVILLSPGDGAVVLSAAMTAGIPARIRQAMIPKMMFRFLYED
jgi:hypothetical protein